MAIGNRIKRLREARGLTQVEVSEGILSNSHYSNIERGRFKPSNSTLKLLADRLSVPVDYLIVKESKDSTMKLKLDQLNLYVEKGQMAKAKSHLKVNQEDFKHISSFDQEKEYQLIYCHFLFRDREITSFRQAFQEHLESIKKGSEIQLPHYLLRKFNYLLGIYYFYSEKYTEAISTFLAYLKSDCDLLASAQISFNLSLCYHRLNHYDTSLEWARRSLADYLHLHDWPKVGQCYNMCGLLLRNLGSIEEAEKEFSLGLSIITDKEDVTLPKIYHNLALLYKEKGDWKKALNLIEESIRIKETLKKQSELFLSNKVKAEILLEGKRIQEAENTMLILSKLANSKRESYFLVSLEARMAFLQGKEKEYLRSMRECITFFNKTKDWVALKEHAEELSIYLARQSQYKEAYELLSIAYNAHKHIKN